MPKRQITIKELCLYRDTATDPKVVTAMVSWGVEAAFYQDLKKAQLRRLHAWLTTVIKEMEE